jgi:hypothetical protein
MHPRIRELSEYLDSQRVVLRDAFQAVPAYMRDRSPGDGRWSPAAVIEHLAIIEQRIAGMFAEKIAAATVAGVAPETSMEPILPTINTAAVLDRSTRVTTPPIGQPTGLPADAAWDALERAGSAVREALAAGDGLALGTITHKHPLFGPMSLYHWFGFIGAHEARHAEQIREIIAETVTS